MRYRDRSTGELLNIHQIRLANPNPCIPETLDAESCDLFNVDPVVIAEPHTPANGNRIVPGPVVEIGGVFTETWIEESIPYEEKLSQAKARRSEEVQNITVTTQAGNTFDGNEDAQRRMTTAITAMDDSDAIPWVLSNNTICDVTKFELKEALRLSGLKMAEIWIKPYSI